jgi:hypothetical protein
VARRCLWSTWLPHGHGGGGGAAGEAGGGAARAAPDGARGLAGNFPPRRLGMAGCMLVGFATRAVQETAHTLPPAAHDPTPTPPPESSLSVRISFLAESLILLACWIIPFHSIEKSRYDTPRVHTADLLCFLDSFPARHDTADS